MDDDPRKIARFIRLARQTAAVLKQNIALALGMRFFPWPRVERWCWMAVFPGHELLLVVFDGLRLLASREGFRATNGIVLRYVDHSMLRRRMI